MKKKQIKKTFRYEIDTGEYTKPQIDKLFTDIDVIFKNATSHHKNVVLDSIKLYLGHEYGWDECEAVYYVEYMYSREETDKEMAARKRRSDSSKKSAVTRKAKLEAQEKAQLEKLKNKYEKP